MQAASPTLAHDQTAQDQTPVHVAGVELHSHLGSSLGHKGPRSYTVSNGTRSLSVQWAGSHSLNDFFKYM